MTKKHRKKDRSILSEPTDVVPDASVELNDEHGEPLECTTSSPPVDASEEAIRVLAYHKWIAAGCPEGDGVGHWLEAEQQVLIGKPDA